jgi:hypothetical protein
VCFLWGTNLIYICYVKESRPPLWSSRQSSWLHNGDLLCFLWGTNWIYICYVRESRPPLCSTGQSSWPQIRRPGFDSRHYQIFWEAVGLERGPLSLVSTIEELLGRKSSGSGIEIREYGNRDPSRWPRYPQKLVFTSPTSGDRSVGIVRSRTQTMEFLLSLVAATAAVVVVVVVVVVILPRLGYQVTECCLPTHYLHADFLLGSFSILKIEVICSSETSVHTRTTRRYIP